MTALAVPLAVIRALPLIHTARAQPATGQAARAWVETLGARHTGTGPTVLGLNEACAWEAMCAKLTGRLPRPVQLWADTRSKLHERYQQAQQTLCSLAWAKRALAAVLLPALVERNGRAACAEVLEALGDKAQVTRNLLAATSVTNEDACAAALRDTLRNAAEWAANGARDACELAELDANVLSTDDAPIFKGSPTRAMLSALRHRIAFEASSTLVLLGLGTRGADNAQMVVGLGSAELADPGCLGDYVVALWTEDATSAIRAACDGWEKLRGASTMELCV